MLAAKQKVHKFTICDYILYGRDYAGNKTIN